MDDQSILTALRNGGQDAFDQLYAQYFRQLFSFAHAMLGSVQDAEDVVQERFIFLLGRPHIWKRVTELRPYLFKVINNACLRHIGSVESAAKKEQMYLRYLSSWHENDQPEILRQLNAAQRARILAPLLSRLGRQCRRAIELVYFDDKTYAEAASIMGISKDSIKTHLSAGKAFFRKRIDALMHVVLMLCVFR